MTRFLVDAQLPPALARWLEAQGHMAEHVFEFDGDGTTDGEIWMRALGTGAIMAATILNSPRATEMSVFIVRAFVQLREALATHKQVAQKLDALERKVSSHDKAIAGLIDAIRQLMMPSVQPKRPIGFTAAILRNGANVIHVITCTKARPEWHKPMRRAMRLSY